LTGGRLTRPITVTKACCRSARQSNPGRRSTYRSGKAVRTSETTSLGHTVRLIPPAHVKLLPVTVGDGVDRTAMAGRADFFC
jgi:hypothetical protein